jgi:hypothetical protein
MSKKKTNNPFDDDSEEMNTDHNFERGQIPLEQFLQAQESKPIKLQ